jgi:hypothetical protein
VLVYRIEHWEEGYGPYWSKRFTVDVSHDHLAPKDDFATDAWKHPDHKFGFRSLAELYAWFDRREVRALREQGFHITVFDVPDSAVTPGRSQVAFPGWRETYPRPGRRLHSWPVPQPKPRIALTEPRLTGFARAYLAMARIRYRPFAPAHWETGNLELSYEACRDPVRLAREAEAYAVWFAEQYDNDAGGPWSVDPTGIAFVWTIAGSERLANGAEDDDAIAARLFRMAERQIERWRID